MTPHFSTLAWKIPWMEEPGRLQSMGSIRVGHDWATSLSLFTFMHWRRKWQPTPVFLPGESRWAAVYGVAQSRTRLKWLRSSSSHDLQWFWSPPKIKSDTVSTVSPSICHEVMGPDAMILVFWMLVLSQLFYSPLSLSSRGSLVLHFLLWASCELKLDL